MTELLDFDDEQIKNMLDSLNEKERESILDILQDFADTGSLSKFNTLMEKDFDEIPVDIDTFITDDKYLGKSLKNTSGECIIFPFWRDRLREIFVGGKNNYNEVILTGGIGLGKSLISVVGASYILYKLLCLKNPQEYYNQAPNTKIYIVFFNITLAQSFGVAYKLMQEYLQRSPWFMERGTVSGRKNLVYTPNKNIEFMVGSKPEHGLGRNIFCLDGNTKIKLADGTYRNINEVDNDYISTLKLSVSQHELTLLNALYEEEISAIKHSSVKTKKSDIVYKLTLEDGTEIIGSDNHKLLMNNKRYKQMKNIKNGDELFEVGKNENS